MDRSALGEFEHTMLLAILRLRDDAYAPAIVAEIESRTGRDVSAGAMYVTLDRLQEKGFLKSRFADADDARGGRPRRYVTVTPAGLRQLRAARRSLFSLWSGLEAILDA